MAILAMRRISIIALKKDRKAILEKLQALGILETDDLFAEDKSAFSSMDTSAARAGFGRNIQVLEQAIGILDRFVPEKKGMLSSLEGKEEISRAEYDEVVRGRDKTVDEARGIVRLEKHITDNESAVKKLENDIEALRPWQGLGVPMRFRGTERTALLLGMMPSDLKEEEIGKILKDAAENYDFEVLSSDQNGTAVSVLCLREEEEKLTEALNAHGFTRPSVMTGKTPDEKIAQNTETIRTLQAEMRR